ncbi:Chaperone-modulator protein CbpM [hydrothermal vent metagenome]|uniref:Chaperone-modulator protein CbpM n=1 Tax=hydrothermal vent metagenome TaxID=652676 RepID=A0A3B0WUN3_9ZZZZ
MNKEIFDGLLLDEQKELTLNDLSLACSRSAEWVIELVDEGVIEPLVYPCTQWRFESNSLQRAHTAMRLQRDLGINLAGVALAIDLLDKITDLESRLRCIHKP